MKRKAPSSREEACVLCLRSDSDPDLYGEKRRKDGVCAHENCLYLANGLPVRLSRRTGEDHFLPADIRRVVKQATRKVCYVCGERGATILCRQKNCQRSFHFPCGCEDGCVCQFTGKYRSFCRDHRPEQRVEARQDEETICLICLEPVEEKLSYHTMVCPACLHAWFHRGCIQKQALRSGWFTFQCPQCRDTKKFRTEMSSLGIRIPVRDSAWEANGAFDELYERHHQCNASRCLCPGGREQAEEDGPWHLFLCSSCAARGTHRRCSGLRATSSTWECDDCAGLGTASSAQAQTARCSSSSQVTSPSSAAAPERGSQAASSPSSTTAPESSSGAMSSPSSTASPESSSRSQTGPERRPGRSRLPRRSRHPYRRP